MMAHMVINFLILWTGKINIFLIDYWDVTVHRKFRWTYFLRRAGTFSQSSSGFLRLIVLLMQCSQKINAALHKCCYEMTSFSQTITLLKLPADKRWCFRLFTVRWNVNFKSSGDACWKKINTFIPMVTLKQGMLIQCRALFARANTCATRQRTPLCGALLHLIKIITPSRVFNSEIQDSRFRCILFIISTNRRKVNFWTSQLRTSYVSVTAHVSRCILNCSHTFTMFRTWKEQINEYIAFLTINYVLRKTVTKLVI